MDKEFCVKRTLLYPEGTEVPHQFLPVKNRNGKVTTEKCHYCGYQRKIKK